jgi:hypothetical protein
MSHGGSASGGGGLSHSCEARASQCVCVCANASVYVCVCVSCETACESVCVCVLVREYIRVCMCVLVRRTGESACVSHSPCEPPCECVCVCSCEAHTRCVCVCVSCGRPVRNIMRMPLVRSTHDLSVPVGVSPTPPTCEHAYVAPRAKNWRIPAGHGILVRLTTPKRGGGAGPLARTLGPQSCTVRRTGECEASSLLSCEEQAQVGRWPPCEAHANAAIPIPPPICGDIS